jgi:hypothetical protein
VGAIGPFKEIFVATLNSAVEAPLMHLLPTLGNIGEYIVMTLADYLIVL